MAEGGCSSKLCDNDDKMAEGRGCSPNKIYGYDIKLVDESNKAEDGKEGFDRDGFTCPICLMILREPKQAENCGHRFCKTCIEEYHEKK